MANLPTSRLARQNAPERAAADSSVALRCQWCMINLEPGAEVCPTCGSPGINTAMIVPGSERTPGQEQPGNASPGVAAPGEWWNDEDEVAFRNASSSEQETDRFPIIAGLLVTVAICIAGGFLLAPLLLADLFESSLGVVVENPNDLRPLGGVLGLLAGAFISAIGIWVTSPRS